MSAKFSHGRPFGRRAVRVQSGFNLVEMMVALAVAGILFFVALPGYQDAVIKSGRAAARASLLEVAARQEQHFVNNKQYAASFESLGLPAPFYVDARGEAAAPDSAVYRVDLDLVEGGYDGATASPLNRQAADKACMAFSLSRIGIRSVTGTLSSEPALCW